MRIAITGSNGFIGKHIKDMLIDMNHQVVSISNNIDHTNEIENYTYNDFFLGNIKIKLDCILHLASPNYDFCRDDSLRKGISELTYKVVSSLHFYECNKLIYFSSAKVYGEPSFDQNIYFENSPLSPKTDYGKEKVKAEDIVRTHSNKSGIDYIIYRMPMVYGKNMNSNIGNLINMINNSIPIPYFSIAESYKKSFLAIDNIKRCIAYNVKNPDSINQSIFNLADNGNYSLNEFIQKYKIMIGSKSVLIKLPSFIFIFLLKIPIFKIFLTKLYGSFNLNNDKINNNMNIHNKSLEEGISAFVNINE